MPDVKIKGYSGNELEYKDVPKVYLAAPESTPDNPVLVPFTYGEAVEDVEISPDFSAGDMTITVPDGYLARSAVVKRPTELIPENVAEGVNIAGIIGTLVAGGSQKLTYGTFTGNNGMMTIEHGLGVVPDIAYIYTNATISGTNKQIRSAFSVSSKLTGFTGLSGQFIGTLGIIWDGSKFNTYATSGKLDGKYTTTAILNYADENTFQAGFSSGVVGNYTYYWFAIGGLT